MTEIEVRVRQNGRPYLRVRLKESPATIGRDPEADVHLDSTHVSRVHARLFWDAQSIRVVDAGSTNGVQVDGVQHARADVEPTHTITICDFSIRARRITSATELGEELSEGWLAPDDDGDDDDDTSAGRQAPTTFVGDAPHARPMSDSPSVSLAAEDIMLESSFHDRPDTNVDPTDDEEYEPERFGTRREKHELHDDDAFAFDERAPAITDDSEEAEELDAERVPTDVPSVVSFMRNAPAELENSRLTRRGVVVEVLVCVGARLHDVALVKPGDQYWWGYQPGFPANLWTVPAVDRFPLVSHRDPGIFDVQVPQDSTWKMFHRGDNRAPTYRMGQLVGMRVGVRESAEVNYGPYTIYLRCVRAPEPLLRRFDLRPWLPDVMTIGAFIASLVLNIVVLALPGNRHRFLDVPTQEEHFMVHEVAFTQTTPQEIPVPELEIELPSELAMRADTGKTAAEPAPGVANEPPSNKPPLLTKQPKKLVKPVEDAKVSTVEAAPTPKRTSIDDFRVSPLLQTVADPVIAPSKGPPVSGGAAMLRGDRAGTSSVIDKSGGSGFSIIPPGRLEPIDVTKTVNSHARELRRCQDTNPEAAGRLDLQWIVEENGSVRTVRVVLDELRSNEMTRCIKDVVARWTFPPPKGGAAVVSFPFKFENPNL